ncbi:hypothetical protein [Sphingomonas sp. LM7]|uniref:hypothetical protein n=1 Tax=Sphingomonas sp. LM7 TaxID=1938607 RepID=UPI0012379A40|nr:hypothetical protein [Sphingomonas sp. LM7]
MLLFPQTASAAAVHPAPDRMLSLVPRGSEGAEYCSEDRRWCVSLSEAQDAEAPVLPVVRTGDPAPPMPHARSEAYSNETYAVWPRLILLKDGGFLAGVETRTSTAYSGGGGSATELQLFRLALDGQAPKPVLQVPVGASLLIRACFSERDMRYRRGACHDEYSFSASLTLAGETTGSLPALAYSTEARAFPRGVSRTEDSTAKPRLKKSDLVHERDPECSFARRFRFDAAAGAYRPDAPLPECSAYTIP